MSAHEKRHDECKLIELDQSWIEREWARFQAWAAAQRPDGLPAPMLTEAGRKVLQQQDGNHVTHDHR